MRIAILTAASLALAACSSSDEPPEDAAVDRVALSTAETAPAFDPTVDSESEAAEDGRRWYYKTESQSALYGPPNSEGMLTLRCDAPGAGEKRVLFSWFARGAAVGEERVLEVRSGGDVVRADVDGVANELGSVAMWQARLVPEGEQAEFLLATDDPVSIRLDDGADYAIRVPTSEQLRQVIRDCR